MGLPERVEERLAKREITYLKKTTEKIKNKYPLSLLGRSDIEEACMEDVKNVFREKRQKQLRDIFLQAYAEDGIEALIEDSVLLLTDAYRSLALFGLAMDYVYYQLEVAKNPTLKHSKPERHLKLIQGFLESKNSFITPKENPHE